MAALGRHLPADGIVTMDAGNFGSWLHRHFRFRSSQGLVGAVSGAMGLGTPAAVAAALRYPTRQVVGLVGDGGFLMTGSELATAVQYGALGVTIASPDQADDVVQAALGPRRPGGG